MLSSPPPAGYGLPASNSQSNQLLGPSVRRGGGAGGGLTPGVPGLSSNPLSPQALQQGKLAAMVRLLMSGGAK